MKMRKIKRILAVIGMLCLTQPILTQASQATSYTYTHDDKMNSIRTQDAYLPQQTITNLGLNAAEDMFIDKNNMMYIADTGNMRIVKYDISRGIYMEEFSHPEFQAPKGIYVTADGTIYVADSKAKAVFVFDQDWKLLKKLERPQVPAFGDTPFDPAKVAADGRGNVYIVGEGVYSGVIQMSEEGEFQGFFAVNKTDLTTFQKLQTVFFTREQLSRLLNRNPVTFANVTLDDRGIVYTVTLGKRTDPIKKHKTDGSNMFAETVYGFEDINDIWVDENLLIYTASKRGYVDVYTAEGELLFEFGSYVTTVDIAGLFTSLPSIAVDVDGNIWAVDGAKGYLQSFRPTEYAQTVYTAMNLYEEGRYEEAMEKWNEVLRLNQMSVLAHNGVGKAYLHAEDYEASLEHFKVANNKEYYSQSFWEVRNTWIQKWMGLVLGLLIGLLVLRGIVKAVDKRHGGRLAQAKRKAHARAETIPIWKDILYALKTPRHPMDCYYEIRKYRQGSVLSAAVIYLLFFIDFMAFKTVKGFIYQTVKVENMDIGSIVLGFFALLGLFVVCNYLVTSINDGDGTFKQIFMIPANGLMPAMIALLIVTCVSYVLTYNEAFLLTLVLLIGIVWSAVTIFIGLQTVHDYTFGETVKSIVLTVVFMIIVAVIGIIISIMWNSLYTFLASVGKEMIQNVF